MTAPVWMAFPPEVHSALLSSGPGPGSLLAAAEAWNSLGIEYAAVADELSALVVAVQSGAWEGPSAESYTAANAPYVAWLLRNSADSTVMATQHATAATAYTLALAAMPTLAELAANHTIHAVLLATNFFGINTIPIALNEADYVRMWIQAATTMSTYQVASTAAVAAAPQTTPAPQIVKSDAASNPTSNLESNIETYLYSQLVQFQTAENRFVDQLISQYLGYTHTGTLPTPKDPFTAQYPTVSNSQALASIEGYYNQYVLAGGQLTPGKPLAYDLGNALFFINYTFVDLLPGDIGEIAHGNIYQIFSLETAAIVFSFVSMRISNVLEIINVGLNSGLIASATVPVFATPVAGLSGLAGFAGLAGLAQQAAAMAPAVAVPAAIPPPLAIAHVVSAPAPPAAPAGVPVTSPVHAVTGPGAPPPPPVGAPPPIATGTESFGYMVGYTETEAQASAQAKTREPIYRSASSMPAAAAITRPASPPARRRRRRANVNQLGRRYEYLDLDQVLDDQSSEQLVASVAASDRGAGALGVAGADPRAEHPAGLSTLAGDTFGGGPTVPMVPGTWGDRNTTADDAEPNP
ncbi:PPE family protein [Mycobacterium malmoense]|uniref:PPE family protein n=1 Tax=Mycobacterium malmoense TaxID=1780 RepID=UPI0008F91F3F|nr:PPE family protein [Mycobacterium malmoense]OIN79260.1 hypothetical protein BMG05_19045 [Mycobacterium malmoense]